MSSQATQRITGPGKGRKAVVNGNTADDAGAPPANRALRGRERTRRKLLEAAQGVMSRTGVEGATIAQIAEEADVAFGSFYNHFKSKEEIALTVFSERIERLGGLLDSVRHSVADPAMRVSIVQRTMLREARSDPIWGWFLIRAGSTLEQIHRTFHDRAMLTLVEGLALRRFNFRSAETVLTITISALFGVVRGMLEGTIPHEADSDVVEMLLRMYGVDPVEAAQLARAPIPVQFSEAQSAKSA
ncbi:MAG: transcriptional regulator, TetR family [Ramlibacter sp.]|nr:transcriptional regulator, TetR family [Ramlibacter sp.]